MKTNIPLNLQFFADGEVDTTETTTEATTVDETTTEEEVVLTPDEELAKLRVEMAKIKKSQENNSIEAE